LNLPSSGKAEEFLADRRSIRVPTSALLVFGAGVIIAMVSMQWRDWTTLWVLTPGFGEAGLHLHIAANIERFDGCRRRLFGRGHTPMSPARVANL
jgi:hypothetical protein